MSEDENTLLLACDKWVSTETAEQMIRAVAPPNVNARKILHDGSIRKNKTFERIGWSKMEQLERDPTLPTTGYEWYLQSLILRLLVLRAAEAWSIGDSLILRLATIEPDQLAALELEKLAEVKQLAASRTADRQTEAGLDENIDERIRPSDKATDMAASEDRQNISKLLPGKPQKVRGSRPDPLWSKVLGWAAGWLAVNGDPNTQAELERVIEERFISLNKNVGETQIAAYAEGLLEGYRAHRKRPVRNSD